jgi:hypothetical protein
VRSKPSFWDVIMKNHNLSLGDFSSDKMNYILHYLNTRQYKKEIIQFLANSQKFIKIKSQPDEMFAQFRNYELWQMRPKTFLTHKELKTSVKNIINYIKINYNVFKIN